jgi:hypothetical protein
LPRLEEPVVLLAMLAIPPVFFRFTTGRALVCIFALVSFVIAAATDIHPGGNINYFFECLFAVVPLAAIGVAKLLRISRRNVSMALFVVALFMAQLTREKWPELRAVIDDARHGFPIVTSENASFRQLQHALQGQHIFSTIERLALLDPAPALVNAFSFWTIPHPQLIYNRVRAEEFDVVLTRPVAERYRGVFHITPDLHKAISSAYVPYCIVGQILVHLPRNAPANDFKQKLNQIGCEAIPASALASLAW